MNAIFKKLNFKDQKEIFVINAPSSFKPVMAEMADVTKVKTSLKATEEVAFFLAFVTKQKEVDELANLVTPVIVTDGVLWLAYPKGSSKNYTCEFNRDNGWTVLGENDFEPVRMVAIDEDWSALRFRKAENIKRMTRSSAISKTGKERLASRTSKRK